jgi:hypothetical protein
VKVNRVRDIKMELTQAMLNELNQIFNEFGVYIENVIIMNVIIPKDLRQALSDTTNYDVKLQNQYKF